MRPRTLIVNVLLGAALIYATIRACADNPGLALALTFLAVMIGAMLIYGYVSGRKTCSGCIVESMQTHRGTGEAYALTSHSCAKSRWFYVSRDGSVHREFGKEVKPRKSAKATVVRKRPKELLVLDKKSRRGAGEVVHIKERRAR